MQLCSSAEVCIEDNGVGALSGALSGALWGAEAFHTAVWLTLSVTADELN